MTPTPEQLALARRIVALHYQGVRDHDYASWVLRGREDTSAEVQIALAAIIATQEANAVVATSFRAPPAFASIYCGEHDEACNDIAAAIRAGDQYAAAAVCSGNQYGGEG
jgi:hypothetical protein